MTTSTASQLSRRAICSVILGIIWPLPLRATASSRAVLVHKDPNCGCCGAWTKHLASAGFSIEVEETSDLDEIRRRLGVPVNLAACHTAQVAGYVVEGHVPAVAINRLLEERPNATGIAVAGMPPGSPGMGGRPWQYSVVLFGRSGSRTYMKFIGSEEAP